MQSLSGIGRWTVGPTTREAPVVHGGGSKQTDTDHPPFYELKENDNDLDRSDSDCRISECGAMAVSLRSGLESLRFHG